MSPRPSVRVDVNQHWNETGADLGTGLLHDAGVDLVEQLFARHAIGAMQRLSAKHIDPLVTDQALHGPADAFNIANGAAAKVFAIKIAQLGGLLPAYTIAESAGIGVYGGTMLEGDVGTAATTHLCASLPSLAWGTELFGPLLLKAELLAEPLWYADFELELPTGPGLGIALDEDRVAFPGTERFKRRSYRVRTVPLDGPAVGRK